MVAFGVLGVLPQQHTPIKDRFRLLLSKAMEAGNENLAANRSLNHQTISAVVMIRLASESKSDREARR